MESDKPLRNHSRAFLILGLVFFANGVTLLTVGLVTKLVALWAMGPGLLGVGIVFLVLSRKHLA